LSATPQHHPGEQDSLKKWSVIILVFGLLALTAGWLAYVDLMRYAAAPSESGGRSEKKIVAIEKGQNFRQTTLLLQSQQLIDHPFKFRLLARLQGKDKQIQAGEYLLSADMPPGDILAVLVNGKVRLYKVTVPEGSTLKQIAAIVEDAGLTTRAASRGIFSRRPIFSPKIPLPEQLLRPCSTDFGPCSQGHGKKERPTSAFRCTRSSPWHRSSKRKPALLPSGQPSRRCFTTACGGECVSKPIQRSSTELMISTAT
jgi:hypothetical protein